LVEVVVSYLLRISKLNGGDTTKEVRVMTDAAEICEATLQVDVVVAGIAWALQNGWYWKLLTI
jgi:hypothetical protein